jgi:hypothetical protein
MADEAAAAVAVPPTYTEPTVHRFAERAVPRMGKGNSIAAVIEQLDGPIGRFEACVNKQRSINERLTGGADSPHAANKMPEPPKALRDQTKAKLDALNKLVDLMEAQQKATETALWSE